MDEKQLLEAIKGIVDEAISGVNQRFDGVDQRLDGVDQRLDGVNQRLDGVDQRLDDVNQRLDDVNQRLDGVDQRFDGVDQRLDTIELNQRHLMQAVKEIDDRLISVESNVHEIKRRQTNTEADIRVLNKLYGQ